MYTARRTCLTTLAALVVAVTALRGQPQVVQRQETFRSSIDVVTIQTSVRDSHGRSVQGLTAADFEVRDNGELRPVLSLRADRQSPVSLALLIDTSGSMQVGSKVEMVRKTIRTLLSQLRAGEDEVGVFTFDSSLHEREPFTSDLEKLKGSLSLSEPFGTTSLYDAIATTSKRLADRTAAHKAVIVLTDGVDTSSTLTAPEVSGIAGSIDVPVYIVATIPAVDQRALKSINRQARSDAGDLRHLAEWTGGQLVFASRLIDSAVVAVNLVNELRQQYVLAIEAASVHEWRRLDVRVKYPATVVKARSGYFGG
jgi:Ca-activated chloride channel family protein